MVFRIKIALKTACLLAGISLSSAASADTLNFLGELGFGRVNSTTAILSNATIETSEDNLFVHGAGNVGDTLGVGSIGSTFISSERNNVLGNDLTITFNSIVSNVMFDTYASGLGSRGHVKAYFGTTVLGRHNFDNAHESVDLSGLGQITSLIISDTVPESHGYYFNNFSFDTVGVSAVPLPAALPLFGAAMAGLGFLGWKRKRDS
ncbi:MAG: VPLPA-CTERM sorting domain-containing protein [Desulfobacterales bacterium]|nr:VPLPA-CTERM sorting domain-containing protein [Desulfobacterales bacterium]